MHVCVYVVLCTCDERGQGIIVVLGYIHTNNKSEGYESSDGELIVIESNCHRAHLRW
jgi:hypothetical protein